MTTSQNEPRIMRRPVARGAAILGIGDYRPTRKVTNDDLATRIETTDAWIRERTGIESRRIAGTDETVVSMAVEASAKALAAAGVAGAEVGLILLATCSMTRKLPGGAAEVALGVGATSAGAADLNAACAGFCYALGLAADAVRSGSADYVLVIGSEKISDWIDWDDRGTCILFGDGAGAVVVGPSSDTSESVGPVVWASDGTATEAILVADRDSHLTMDGQAVFRWATTTLAPVARAACEAAGVEPSDLKAFVPHQANLRIIESLARSLKLTDVVIARDIVDTGNTSAASVPLALARLLQRGEVASGDLALLIGFGSGLSVAAQVVRCP